MPVGYSVMFIQSPFERVDDGTSTLIVAGPGITHFITSWFAD